MLPSCLRIELSTLFFTEFHITESFNVPLILFEQTIKWRIQVACPLAFFLSLSESSPTGSLTKEHKQVLLYSIKSFQKSYYSWKNLYKARSYPREFVIPPLATPQCKESNLLQRQVSLQLSFTEHEASQPTVFNSLLLGRVKLHHATK